MEDNKEQKIYLTINEINYLMGYLRSIIHDCEDIGVDLEKSILNKLKIIKKN